MCYFRISCRSSSSLLNAQRFLFFHLNSNVRIQIVQQWQLKSFQTVYFYSLDRIQINTYSRLHTKHLNFNEYSEKAIILLCTCTRKRSMNVWTHSEKCRSEWVSVNYINMHITHSIRCAATLLNVINNFNRCEWATFMHTLFLFLLLLYSLNSHWLCSFLNGNLILPPIEWTSLDADVDVNDRSISHNLTFMRNAGNNACRSV